MVIAVLLPFLVAAAQLSWTAWRLIRKRKWQECGWGGYLIGTASLAVVALTCEKLIGGVGEAIEEVAELGIAALLLLVSDS